MTSILCNRRGCNDPATVDVYTDNNYIDEHVCDKHAKEGIASKVEKIQRYVRRTTKKPVVELRVEWIS